MNICSKFIARETSREIFLFFFCGLCCLFIRLLHSTAASAGEVFSSTLLPLNPKLDSTVLVAFAAAFY